MNNRQLPGADSKLDDLPDDPKQQHEDLVELFGRYVMWMRNRTIDSARDLLQSEDVRERLGKVHRRPYEEIGALSDEDQQRAIRFAETTVDAFIELLLRVLAHRGMDFRFGASHAIRYKLTMEICDRASGQVVLEETINRHGQKHFADYWGRWLNRHSHEGRHPGTWFDRRADNGGA